jgi:hypothetical protein
MVYFLTFIPATELTAKVVEICLEQFGYCKGGQDSTSMLVLNRCLIALQNITCTENEDLLQFCSEKGVLEILECLTEDYPIGNRNKLVILEIYGNMIFWEIANSEQQSTIPNLYPTLLE